MKLNLAVFCLVVLTAATLAQTSTATLETAPPVVIRTVPVAGATNVNPALTEIHVTFSKTMLDNSWSWSTWGEQNFPELVGQPRYLPDRRTCVATVKLEPGKFYAIWLNSEKFRNFKDADGRSAVPYLLTFATAAASGETKSTSGAPSARTGEQVAVEDVALRVLAAMRDKEDAVLKQLATDHIDGWRDSLPHFAFELRERFRQLTGKPLALWPTESVVEGDLAAVKCTGPAELEGKYLVLFFTKTPEGWRNWSLRNSLPEIPLRQYFGRSQTEFHKAKTPQETGTAAPDEPWQRNLNDDQRTVLAWTDRQFRSYFDAREFDGWSETERTALETRLIDALKGPRSREYYQAINTLGAMRSTNALPALRAIAYDLADKNNRDRWMAIRALGLIGEKTDVPELIHLVYHGNVNTRWWAQLSLVRLTGENFGSDWNAWGKWWNQQNGQPPYRAEIIRWWSGQPETEKLAESLAESDRKFLADARGK